LERKFSDQATVISRGAVDQLLSRCWNVDRLENMNELIALTVPAPA